MVWFAVWPFGWKLKPSQTQFKLQTVSMFGLKFLVYIASILSIIVLMCMIWYTEQIESHVEVVYSSYILIKAKQRCLKSFETIWNHLKTISNHLKLQNTISNLLKPLQIISNCQKPSQTQFTSVEITWNKITLQTEFKLSLSWNQTNSNGLSQFGLGLGYSWLKPNHSVCSLAKKGWNQTKPNFPNTRRNVFLQR